MALTISTPYKNNTLASVSGTTFTSNGTPFVAGDVGRCIVMTSGVALGQMRKITAYISTTQVTIDYAWNISPFSNEINAQTATNFVEVLPVSGNAWSMSHSFDDIDDTTNIAKVTPTYYRQVGTNVITFGTGVFIYGSRITFEGQLGLVRLSPTAFARFGDISSTGYVGNSCTIIDTAVTWTPNRSWTNTVDGDAGDFHMYGGNIIMTTPGNATEFTNPMWSFFRSQTAIYRLISVQSYGEFGMRIQGDNSILLNFYASNGSLSAYNKVHPLPMGLFKNVRVTNSKGVIYWRVSDGNLVNVYNVEFEKIAQQLIYQTNAGVNAIFNVNGFKASQIETLTNVVNVTTDDPDGTVYLRNPIKTSVVDSSLATITDPYRRVIWSPANAVLDNILVTDGDWDSFYVNWWSLATTPVGLKNLAAGTTTTPYIQVIISYNYLPNSLVVTAREPSDVKFTALLDNNISLTKSTIDGVSNISNGDSLYDRSKSWKVDNLHLAYPTKSDLLIKSNGKQLDLGSVSLILDSDYGSAFNVNTGTSEMTINTNNGGSIVPINSNEKEVVASSILLDIPSGVLEDDLILVILCHSESEDNLWTTTGWNVHITEHQVGGTPTSTPGITVLWKIASASEPAAYTLTGSFSSGIVGQVMLYRGVDTTNPFDVSGTVNSSASGNPTPSSITTINDGSEIICIGVMDDGTSTLTSQPTGYSVINTTSTLGGN